MFPNRSTHSITLMQVITTKFKNKDRKKTQEAWQPNKPNWNHNFRPRTGVFGAYNWNTPKSIPNAHLNQDWCETNGNFFDEMAEFFSCLGDQTDPKIRPGSEAHILLTSKGSSSEHENQDWCGTSGNFWENDQRSEFVLLWCPQLPENGAPEAHFYTPLKLSSGCHDLHTPKSIFVLKMRGRGRTPKPDSESIPHFSKISQSRGLEAHGSGTDSENIPYFREILWNHTLF